jgi:hypothetical protein
MTTEIGTDDFISLTREVPLRIEDFGGVEFSSVRDEGGDLWAEVTVYTLGNGTVMTASVEDRAVVRGRHRHDSVRLLRWFRAIGAQLRARSVARASTLAPLAVADVVPEATAVLEGVGPWAATHVGPFALRRKLPRWAGPGAQIVRVSERDTVYCTDERQFDATAAAAAGFGALPCLRGFDGRRARDDDGVRRTGRAARAQTERVMLEAEAYYEELAKRPTAEPYEPSPRMKAVLASLEVDAEPVTGLLFVPAATALEALAVVRFGNFNSSPPTSVHMAVLRHWKERYGAFIAGVSFDTLRLEVPRAPRDAAELRRARFEIDQLQADAYPLDPSAPIWRFWWD